MFWRFGGYANISTLDSILDKPEVTLEDLLEESDLIQEVKAQNAKLIEFLREENVLKKLLNYVIAPKLPEPPERAKSPSPEEKKIGGGFWPRRTASRTQSRDDTESEYEKQDKKRLQYAYYACEILSAEVHSIYEALFEHTEYLVEFWEYLKRDTPLEPQQAGYFTKVNEALLDRKTAETIALIKTIDNVVPNMMRHVDCPVIMDLLLKLISLEKEPEGQGIVDWLQVQGLIPLLLGCITSNHPASTQTSAGDFLKAIITISANATGQDGQVIGPNELTRQLVSEACINDLIGEMLKGGNPLTVGVGIIIEVIRKNNSDYDTDAQIGPEPKSSDPIYLGTLLRIFASHISDFMELILSPKTTIMTDSGSAIVNRKDLKVAWGDKIEPLGFDRFKTCELMAELLHCSNMGLLNERGSDAAVKARDEERERLKAEGKLASLPIPLQQPVQADFGGESPEDVKKLEVQNSADDEDFENVAMSEAVPENSHSENPDTASLTRTLDAMTIGENLEMDPSGEDEETTKALAALKINDSEGKNTSSVDETLPQDSDQVPAPLFSNRANQPPSNPSSETQPQPQSDTAPVAPSTESQTDTQSQTTPSEPLDSSQQPTHIIETEEDGSPVIGDFLKINFVDNRVVPTILDFFFRFPWNNFLHNVVYDVVQQVFNGSMDRGYNRHLAIDLFSTGSVTNRIIEGQARSDEAQRTQMMRLGYMGHLTLIAEEVVKFTERQPAELLAQSVVDRITAPEWINYVENTLTETRDRDNAILGGIRPEMAGGPRQAMLNAVSAAQSPGFSPGTSSALAEAGLTNNNLPSPGLGSMDLSNSGNAAYAAAGNNTSLLSGFGSSDEEDDEELEDVELAEGTIGETRRSTAGHPSGILDDDEQTQTTSHLNDESNDQANSSSAPAPLSIPPSRARRQLAARLAEKQRLASETTSSHLNATFAESSGSASPQSSPESFEDPACADRSAQADGAGDEGVLGSPGVAAALAAVNTTATAPATGGKEAFRSPRQKSHPKSHGGGDVASGSTAKEADGVHSSEEEDEEDTSSSSSSSMDDLDNAATRRDTHDEDEVESPGLAVRQASERRPLDDSDDSDDGVPGPSVPGKGGLGAGGTVRSNAGQAGHAAGSEEDDDSDEDEGPVIMGGKWLRRG